ncbi:uncharacterized protein LOC131533718 isoform X3 [Onychostoma macrolepis]|uniref:uncharacterized protein LOC131533718 isoform X3 n=1 Tax=Onychostoma macrolepis TaxID=369639 RepID=UPI00272D701D|nr:uncharacterized protein LOC131533718 isoform X3 [Onychostoma macrolepis]
MLSTGISWVLLLIPLSTANRGFTNCKGDHTTLFCLDPKYQIEGKVEINALWKKDSGERVIWKYNGDSKKGHTFMNRTVELNDDLSLSIDGCDQSDQGIYILCINGKPSCEVTLFVRDSKQCKPKTFTEQSIRSTAFPTMAKQDEKHLQTETSLPNNYIRWVIYACLCLVVLTVLLLVICVCVAKEETSKNEKSGSKLLSNDIQSTYASA